MSRQSLAVKYRPKTFEDVCGQSITVKILQKSIEQRNFKHCYLFAGDSGCGKTTLARIFGYAINGGLGTLEEMDAASRNGVDDVRALVEAGKQRALDSEYKIFIVDECHAITTQGWQAFLKGIEEPSPYTIFIFCTTEPNKIPETIQNRMQRYNITKIEPKTVYQRLCQICQAEGFTNYEAACDIISKTSHGCMRDAIMKLDQCADFSTDLRMENVKLVLNTVSYEAMFGLIWAMQDQNVAGVLSILDNLGNSGVDLKNFMELLLELNLDITKYLIFQDMACTNIPLYLNTEQNPVVNYTLTKLNLSPADCLNWFNKLTDTLLQIKLDIKYDTNYKSTIGAYLIRFCA